MQNGPFQSTYHIDGISLLMRLCAYHLAANKGKAELISMTLSEGPHTHLSAGNTAAHTG